MVRYHLSHGSWGGEKGSEETSGLDGNHGMFTPKASESHDSALADHSVKVADIPLQRGSDPLGGGGTDPAQRGRNWGRLRVPRSGSG